MSTIPDLETLLQQEQNVRLSRFSFEDAWRVGEAIRQRGVQEKAPIAIEVYGFGQVLFSCALAGSSAENLEWIARKRHTTLRNGHSSLYTGEKNQADGVRMEKMNFMDPQRYSDHGGSFPLLLSSGGIIGAVTVSGLPSHEDHALAMWGIQQIL
ncbi:heme-degrading domain-containing protein [Erwinia sp. BNK-24-b]|uniref:heme-degrading domain-containing protein n=1 Tax=Erwinia TaxID=551 RepID=UPI001FF04F94|nr:heme-degrading domain-containing protein [Erwinia phyllosphaerae]MBV4367144.1 heme-degrading domain-containing protein [Erwinia phyllosphaerae]